MGPDEKLVSWRVETEVRLETFRGKTALPFLARNDECGTAVGVH